MAVIGHDKKHCDTPTLYGNTVGTIWQCECGQRWRLKMSSYGRNWKRVSAKRAKRLMYEAA